MKKTLFLLLIISFCFAFQLPEGKYELNEQGINYGLYVPPKLGDKMILVLSDRQMDRKKAIDFWYEQARRRNYLVIAPESLKSSVWTKEDEERIVRIISIISRDYGRMKILLNGVSESGFFALNLAVGEKNRFVALCNFTGVVISSLSSDIVRCKDENNCLPYLFVHGLLEEEISAKHAKWDSRRILDKGYDVTFWEVDKLPKTKVCGDILDWFEGIISPKVISQ